MERMNTTRDTAAAEVINMRRPLLDSYQGASSAGTDQSDMKANMHHTDSEISETTSFPPAGKASKGNLLFVCGRKERLSGVQMVIPSHAALIFKKPAF